MLSPGIFFCCSQKFQFLAETVVYNQTFSFCNPNFSLVGATITLSLHHSVPLEKPFPMCSILNLILTCGLYNFLSDFTFMLRSYLWFLL